MNLTKSTLIQAAKAVAIIIAVFASQQLITAGIVVYENKALAIALALIGVVIYAAVIVVTKPFSRKNVRKWNGAAALKNIGLVIGTYLVMYATSFIVAVIKSLSHANIPPANQDAINRMAENGATGLVILMVLMAPLFEEVAFRWAIFDKMFAHMSWKVPFVISSITFAGMHVMAGSLLDIWAWATYLPMAMIFAGLYAWRRDLVLNIAVHLLWNASSVVALIALLK